MVEVWNSLFLEILAYLDNYNPLHQKQSGFRSGHSTESALILLTESWLNALNNGKLVGCIMGDFRKAFDLVDHQLLIKNYIVTNSANYACHGLIHISAT